MGQSPYKPVMQTSILTRQCCVLKQSKTLHTATTHVADGVRTPPSRLVLSLGKARELFTRV
jgi:hypothetical protein